MVDTDPIPRANSLLMSRSTRSFRAEPSRYTDGVVSERSSRFVEGIPEYRQRMSTRSLGRDASMRMSRSVSPGQTRTRRRAGDRQPSSRELSAMNDKLDALVGMLSDANLTSTMQQRTGSVVGAARGLVGSVALKSLMGPNEDLDEDLSSSESEAPLFDRDERAWESQEREEMKEARQSQTRRSRESEAEQKGTATSSMERGDTLTRLGVTADDIDRAASTILRQGVGGESSPHKAASKAAVAPLSGSAKESDDQEMNRALKVALDDALKAVHKDGTPPLVKVGSGFDKFGKGKWHEAMAALGKANQFLRLGDDGVRQYRCKATVMAYPVGADGSKVNGSNGSSSSSGSREGKVEQHKKRGREGKHKGKDGEQEQQQMWLVIHNGQGAGGQIMHHDERRFGTMTEARFRSLYEPADRTDVQDRYRQNSLVLAKQFLDGAPVATRHDGSSPVLGQCRDWLVQDALGDQTVLAPRTFHEQYTLEPGRRGEGHGAHPLGTMSRKHSTPRSRMTDTNKGGGMTKSQRKKMLSKMSMVGMHVAASKSPTTPTTLGKAGRRTTTQTKAKVGLISRLLFPKSKNRNKRQRSRSSKAGGANGKLEDVLEKRESMIGMSGSEEDDDDLDAHDADKQRDQKKSDVTTLLMQLADILRTWRPAEGSAAYNRARKLTTEMAPEKAKAGSKWEQKKTRRKSKKKRATLLQSRTVMQDADSGSDADAEARVGKEGRDIDGEDGSGGVEEKLNEQQLALLNGGAYVPAVRQKQDGLWTMGREPLAQLKPIVKASARTLHGRGVFNETILHDCFLFMSGDKWDKPNVAGDDRVMKALAKFFIQYCPFLVNKVYEHPMYYGESALHLAVVKQELPLCRYLLEHGANVDDRTRGFFFLPHPQTKLKPRVDVPDWVKDAFEDKPVHCYFGEFCLSFAVCTLQVGIVKLMLDAGADPNAIDSLGNTSLHALVDTAVESYEAGAHDAAYMTRVDSMYRFLRENPTAPADTFVLNNRGLTPLSLSASVGCYELFDNILRCERNMLWSYGPVSCHEYPLQLIDSFIEPALAGMGADGSDSPRNRGAWRRNRRPKWCPKWIACCCGPEEGKDADGGKSAPRVHAQRVLSVVVERKRYELLEHPIVYHLLKDKWEAFARLEFHHKIAQSLTHLLLLMAAIALRPHDEDLIDSSQGGLMREIVEGGVVLLALVRMGHETIEVREQGWDYLWLNPGENIIEWVFALFISLAGVFRACNVIDPSDYYGKMESVTISAAVIIGWTYFFYITRVLFFLGPLVSVMLNIVRVDLTRFLVIWMVFTLAISQAVVVQYRGRQDQRDIDAEELMFSGILDTMWELLQGMEGARARWRFRDASTPWFSMGIYIFQFIFVTVLLLNILIAMMSDTLQNVLQKANQEWRLQRAEVILKGETIARNKAKWRKFMVENPIYKFDEETRVWTMLIEEKHDKYVALARVTEWDVWHFLIVLLGASFAAVMAYEHYGIVQGAAYGNTDRYSD